MNVYQLKEVYFSGKEDEITAKDYKRLCVWLGQGTESVRQSIRNNIKCVVEEKDCDGIQAIAKQLRKWLVDGAGYPASAIQFEVGKAKIEADGTFWEGCHTSCTQVGGFNLTEFHLV